MSIQGVSWKGSQLMPFRLIQPDSHARPDARHPDSIEKSATAACSRQSERHQRAAARWWDTLCVRTRAKHMPPVPSVHAATRGCRGD
eukprot:2867059-Prymnesium_polylepis.1